ncbi:MAG TPA: HEPN domain-containing protein [Firmicutes bacterium]|nr:HEPN domain-containing protein [Bacillota bacterium]
MEVSLEERVSNWLEEAVADLKTAEILLNAGRFNACAFHSQQAAEKAMKALLLKLHLAPWGHSVWNLYLNAAEELGIEDPPTEEAAKGLDWHYIPSRYPDALPAGTPSRFYDRGKAEEALEWARKVITFVKEHL